jgi:hypothetical protein
LKSLHPFPAGIIQEELGNGSKGMQAIGLVCNPGQRIGRGAQNHFLNLVVE